MKKWLVAIVAVVAVGAVGVTAVFAHWGLAEKKPEDYTLGEVREVLQQYFQEKDINLTPGTSEYLVYLKALDNERLPIQSHPQIDLIKTYAKAYIDVHRNISADKASISSTEMEAFYKKTIGEVLNS